MAKLQMILKTLPITNNPFLPLTKGTKKMMAQEAIIATAIQMGLFLDNRARR
jgi:hypothetical protein